MGKWDNRDRFRERSRPITATELGRMRRIADREVVDLAAYRQQRDVMIPPATEPDDPATAAAARAAA